MNEAPSKKIAFGTFLLLSLMFLSAAPTASAHVVTCSGANATEVATCLLLCDALHNYPGSAPPHDCEVALQDQALVRMAIHLVVPVSGFAAFLSMA